MSRDKRGDGIQEVIGSIPFSSTNFRNLIRTAAERPPFLFGNDTRETPRPVTPT